MKITAIKQQARDDNRVNVFVDGKYSFSLDFVQVLDLGIKVGGEYSEADLVKFNTESDFGKLYSRALEYCLMRPRSVREVKDYLFKKTRPTRDKLGNVKQGVSSELTIRVLNRLMDRGYVDDQKFTDYWISNRRLSKGVSRRKLIAELRAKGIDISMINDCLVDSERNDDDEILKVIAKKRLKYQTDDKLMAYLARLGFGYDDIKAALDSSKTLD